MPIRRQRCLGTSFGLAALFAFSSASLAQSSWDVTQPRGKTREIDFTTSEGTWMSVDIAPGGDWLVFDLLGQIYRIPSGGGRAESLTQGSGIAVNFQPRISPDGRNIAFISDRGGQYNLWLMNADGTNPRAVFNDLALRAANPRWSADGQFIFVQRRPGGLWLYHRDGGAGSAVLSDVYSNTGWASPSRDGRYVYFDVAKERTLEGAVGGSGKSGDWT